MYNFLAINALISMLWCWNAMTVDVGIIIYWVQMSQGMSQHPQSQSRSSSVVVRLLGGKLVMTNTRLQSSETWTPTPASLSLREPPPGEVPAKSKICRTCSYVEELELVEVRLLAAFSLPSPPLSQSWLLVTARLTAGWLISRPLELRDSSVL